MPIDFHDAKNSRTYAERAADETWNAAIQQLVDLSGKVVADLGCGGGIYTRALAILGATHVIGIDSSEVMLTTACRDTHNERVNYVLGDACATGLSADSFDVLLERAVIHHIQPQDQPANLAETQRLLKSGGLVIMQDRTAEDCLLPGSATHIRGYFFERYPKLRDREVARRPERDRLLAMMRNASFEQVEARSFWETRHRYENFAQLAQNLSARSGRSILHDLDDVELTNLIAYIRLQIGGHEDQEIIEQDRWTIWTGRKPLHP